MESQLFSLLSDRGVQCYFLVLGVVIRNCISVYSCCSSSSSSETTSKQRVRVVSKFPLLISVAIIGVTWFLILRFVFANIQTSESYFDDAYKDVLATNDLYFTSTQLLTWAIVAVAWMEAGSDAESDFLSFILFGFLGAMSASFVIWVPTLYHPKKQRRRPKKASENNSVPISYVFTSIIALVSIHQLRPCDGSTVNDGECTPDQGFGSFHLFFRQWLQVLHVILVLPVFLSFCMPSSLPRIDSSILFGTLAVVLTWWHTKQIVVNNDTHYAMPRTDCQISITTDLVCCSLITLYAVYKDSMILVQTSSGGSGNNNNNNNSSSSASAALAKVSVAAICMPMLSPAAILAGHLCIIRLPTTYSRLVSYMQRWVASKRSGREDSVTGDQKLNWCNLGMWPSCKQNNDDRCTSYNQACEKLAYALGKAASLGPSDGLLSCGCGSLEEVQYFKQTFGLRHITGIDPQISEARITDPDDFNVRVMCARAEDLTTSVEEETQSSLFPPRLFDKVVALDTVYHFPDKLTFLRNCYGMLPNGGKVALSDIILNQSVQSTPLWVKLALRAMDIQVYNLWTVNEYRSRLRTVGYDNSDVELIGDQVFNGWKFLPESLLEYIDYAIISANKPTCGLKPVKKKKIAIIGSGLAGLSAAHYLLKTSQADVEVDMFEANDAPGLAGNTIWMGDQPIDIPARMAALGYYHKYRELLDDLNIPTTVVRTDCSFYGTDGQGSYVCRSYGRSNAVNVYNAVFVGGLRRLSHFAKALRKFGDDRGHAIVASETQTFGEWLRTNFSWSRESDHPGSDRNHDLPSITCHDNPFVYVMIGSLSWMLSCTWEQLANYPADIILPYCKRLAGGRFGVGARKQAVRVSPSIKILEDALLYGVNKLKLGTRVTGIDRDRKINGTSYDVVICATEAGAVPKVIKNHADVFGQISYHPSSIYLHTDESFMPKNKSDWQCWNVEMSAGRKEPQLTFWLNGYFPAAKFDTNMFQTWAPAHPPKSDLIIRRNDFQRVVHTQQTRSYVSKIEKDQGKSGIYYAGSYSVYGMGLLEEALISGQNVSDKVIRDLSGKQ